MVMKKAKLPKSKYGMQIAKIPSESLDKFSSNAMKSWKNSGDVLKKGYKSKK
jgi:hypothetical protein